MRERKGLVLKVYEGKVLVLSEGDFIHVETNGKKYERGQEITFRTEIETKKVVNWNRVIGYASIPALVSLFFLIGFPFADDPNTLPEKSAVITMKPVVRRLITSTTIEPKLDSKNVVEINTPQEEKNTQREGNTRIINLTSNKVEGKKDEETKKTKPTNNESKCPSENKEPVRKNPDMKENSLAPVPKTEPLPKTEPIPKKDSNKRGSDDNGDNGIIDVALDREKLSLSATIIRVNVTFRGE